LAHKTKLHSDAVSLQKRHTAALGEIDRYKLLVDSVQDYAIFLMDPDGYIMTWNKGAEKYKGYKADEIIGKHFSNFYMEEDKAADKPARELVLAKQMGRVEDEDWRVRKDGSKFWANVVITPLYNDNHELVAFAKVTRDLTERKAQEDAIKAANKQLKKQQYELEKMNTSKDEFISLASHQLRTPATAIKQLLGMLLEGFYGEVPDELESILEKAYTNNERQLNIVNRLLKVAQLDSGKVILRKELIDINDMLEGIAAEYAETAHARNQVVQYDPSAGPVYLRVDRENLRMSICNLMDNALKYTPEGGTITLGIKREKGDGVIYISDTGVGIGKDDIAKLFDKFVRIPNEMSQKVGGSGLGLYWVQKIVSLHGGKTAVTSRLGQGTTFSIVLPETENA
jgi:PAS domain S-box-containing protein